MKVAVLGAGAFGTALAIALARDGERIGLWARDAAAAQAMRAARENRRRLPGARLPDGVEVCDRLSDIGSAQTLILAMPMQELAGFADRHRGILGGRALIACAKGIDFATGLGPTAILAAAAPDPAPAVLTGPSFAADIARGLPTALTLACRDEALGRRVQEALATPVLRIYTTTDTTGAELGGALKNVIAIAAGVTIGAGLGDSARAALITRGFSEMTRFALDRGARAETLAGLSGLGDLILTCTSTQSRNFRYGCALGKGEPFDPAVTVEGAATARAVDRLARAAAIDMPVAATVAALVDGRQTVSEAMAALLARPLKKE